MTWSPPSIWSCISQSSHAEQAGSNGLPAFDVVHGEVIHPSNARMAELEGVARAPVDGRVLFVGRLEERKGAWVVVEAFGASATGSDIGLASRGRREVGTVTLAIQSWLSNRSRQEPAV